MSGYRERIEWESEFERFLEETNTVRPDPNDEKAVRSCASWFVAWRHGEKVPRV